MRARTLIHSAATLGRRATLVLMAAGIIAAPLDAHHRGWRNGGRPAARSWPEPRPGDILSRPAGAVPAGRVVSRQTSDDG
ncbi:MAG TPA: hypothetical protein VF771_11460 [Longimicrobiaceae bacterium]